MKNLIILGCLLASLPLVAETIPGEKIQCERYLDTIVRCTANGVTCYEDEETGARYCFTDIATIQL